MSAATDAKAARRGIERVPALELWCIDLTATGPALREIEQTTPRLADDDHAYAAGFADATVGQERLATRIALRLLIERAAGSQWRQQPLARQPHGKPFLAGAPAFSVSHVAGMALIGVGADGTIGVDLERSRVVHMREPRRSHIEAAAAALNPKQPLPGDGDQRFLQAWVRLEALAKAEGGGIGRLLTRLGSTRANAATEADWPARAQAALAAAHVAVLGDLALGEGLFAAAAAGPDLELPAVRWLPGNVKELGELIG